MKISEVQIIPVKPQNGFIAIGSLVIDDEIFLGSIGIYTKADGTGYRITYPTKKVGQRDMNIYHPIDKKTSRAIEMALIKKVNKIFSFQKSNEIYDRYNNTSSK